MKRADKKEKLIISAISAFSHYGYESTTVENILEMSMYNLERISRRTFYKFFSGKEDIRDATITYIQTISRYGSFFDTNIDYNKLEVDQILNNLREHFKQISLSDNGKIILKLTIRLFTDATLQKLYDFNIKEYNQYIYDKLILVMDKMGSPKVELHAKMILIYIKGILFDLNCKIINNLEYDIEEDIDQLFHNINFMLRQFT